MKESANSKIHISSNFLLSICLLLISRMRIACWITEVTNTHTHSGCVTLTVFHYNSSCMNAPKCYHIRPSSVLFRMQCSSECPVQQSSSGITNPLLLLSMFPTRTGESSMPTSTVNIHCAHAVRRYRSAPLPAFSPVIFGERLVLSQSLQ
jgi:hypothetical protein